MGAYQQHAPAKAHRAVQLFQSNQPHVEAPQAVTEKIHAVEGHAGKGVEMPGDLEPGRRATERPHQVGTRGAALGSAPDHEIGGDRQQHRTRDVASKAKRHTDQEAQGEAAAALGTLEPRVRHVAVSLVPRNVPFAIVAAPR